MDKYLLEGDSERFNFPFGEKRYSLSAQEKKKILGSIRDYLLQRPEVIFAYVHGSFIEERPFHDIDVALYFTESIPQERRLELCLQLSVDLSGIVRFEVDAHALNDAPLGLRYHATRGKVLMSRDDNLRHDFEEYVWIRYFDFEPIMKQNLRDLLSP